MKSTRLSLLTATLLFTACSAGPPGPPALAYDSDSVQELGYDYSDRTIVSISVMGQSMEMSQNGTAEYAITLSPTQNGLDVSLTVEELDATINAPMSAPVSMDESFVEGALAFSLDRVGNATLGAQPTVRDEATQMVSGLALGHTFFPGLPGRAVGPGDSWTDTVSYQGEDRMGERAETSILQYTVVGDTVIDGRTLLAIGVAGSSESNFQLNISGMAVSQSSNLEVTGHVLWDYQAGIMFESERTGSGEGTITVAIAPGPMPIRVETTQQATLQTGSQ